MKVSPLRFVSQCNWRRLVLKSLFSIFAFLSNFTQFSSRAVIFAFSFLCTCSELAACFAFLFFILKLFVLKENNYTMSSSSRRQREGVRRVKDFLDIRLSRDGIGVRLAVDVLAMEWRKIFTNGFSSTCWYAYWIRLEKKMQYFRFVKTLSYCITTRNRTRFCQF